MDELQAKIEAHFRGVSTAALIGRIERAADFGYDDESIELSRRLAVEGKTRRWVSDTRIEVSA